MPPSHLPPPPHTHTHTHTHTHRPPSPMMDSVREKFMDNAKLAEDLSFAFQGCELADVMFIVGMYSHWLCGVCGRGFCGNLWGFCQLCVGNV